MVNSTRGIPRIFISHSSQDNRFVFRLAKDLRDAVHDDAAVWYDLGLQPGASWWKTIVDEITDRNVFIVVLSLDALDSPWVNDEINIAWGQRNSPTGKHIIPILYGECEVREDLKTLRIISFQSRRKYRVAFTELLTALGVSSTSSPIVKRGRLPRSGNESVVENIEDVLTGTLPTNNESENRLQPVPDTADERIEEQQAPSYGDSVAIGIQEGAFAGDQLMHRPADEVEPMLPLTQHEDAADDDLPLAAPLEVVDSSLADEEPAQAEMQSLPPILASAGNEAADILRFPQPSSDRDTDNIPLPSDKPELEEKSVPAVVPSPTLSSNEVSNRLATVGAADVDADVGTVGGNVTSGSAFPTGVTVEGGNVAAVPLRHRLGWRLLSLTLVVLPLLSLLLYGGMAVAAPGTLRDFGRSVSRIFLGNPPSATVTIMPKSVDVHKGYAITGVTGIPDRTKHQVQARILSSTSQPASKMVSATGIVNTPGMQAKSSLTFTNSTSSFYRVTAGTMFIDVHRVKIVNDSQVDIPPANPKGSGRVTVPGHAVNVGASGDIMAFDFNNIACCGNSAIAVSNTVAFTGGQNPQKYTAVEQRDVDGAANPLIDPLTQSAKTSLQWQKQANEQFVNQPQCASTVTSNFPVGAKATSVTVTVTAKCSAEVYDQNGVQALAANLLKNDATKTPGSGYALAGSVVTMVTQATVIGSNGTDFLLSKVEGIWVYQFSAAYKMQLAKLVAGKSQIEANTFLLGQAGVEKVVGINISGESTLPTDATQITIVVQNVPGLQGSPTPTGTPASTTSSPVPRPSASSVPGK